MRWRFGATVAHAESMSTELTNKAAEIPLEQLLSDLVDAKLEKREADINRLQDEISRRQARGEPAPPPTQPTGPGAER